MIRFIIEKSTQLYLQYTISVTVPIVSSCFTETQNEPGPPSKPSNSNKETQGDSLTGRLTRTTLEGDSPDGGWPGNAGGDGQKKGSTDYPKDLKRGGSVTQEVIVNLERPGGGGGGN